MLQLMFGFCIQCKAVCLFLCPKWVFNRIEHFKKLIVMLGHLANAPYLFIWQKQSSLKIQTIENLIEFEVPFDRFHILAFLAS